MKLLMLAALVAVAVADVSHLSYGPPESSYDASQYSVTGASKSFFEASPTSPSPGLHLPIHEHQDFNARISNFGLAGYSNPPSILDSGFSYTTPAPGLDVSQGFVSSTPAPNFGINSIGFSTPAPSINYNAGSSYTTPSSLQRIGFVSSTPSPGDLNSVRFNSVPNYAYNFGGNGYSTPVPIVNFGSGQLTSVDSTWFNKDAALNSVQVTTSGGSLNDAFGISTIAPYFSGDITSSSLVQSFDTSHQTPQVSKHLYFFAAPEEPEPIRPRVNIASVSAPKKNIRVIFIKAPSPPAVAPVQITAPQQNEEKTVVYVLVKKPEEEQNIQLNTPEPTEPPKPEVFFIKYKTQKEAEEAISNVQAGQYQSGGHVVASDLGGSNFINSIDKEASFKAQPVINYVTSSKVNQGSVPVSDFGSGLFFSTTTAPVLNSGFGYTTSVPSLNLGYQQTNFNSLPAFKSGFAYSTNSPNIGLNGFGFTTPSPAVNYASNLIGSGLEPRSEDVDGIQDISQNLVESSISSSTVAPVTYASSTVAPESFVSSTIAPVTNNIAAEGLAYNGGSALGDLAYNSGGYSPGLVFNSGSAPGSLAYNGGSGVYETSSPAPFSVYGAPGYTK